MSARVHRPELLAAMRTMSNVEVAEKFGISRERVRQLRKTHNVLLPHAHLMECDECAATVAHCMGVTLATFREQLQFSSRRRST